MPIFKKYIHQNSTEVIEGFQEITAFFYAYHYLLCIYKI